MIEDSQKDHKSHKEQGTPSGQLRKALKNLTGKLIRKTETQDRIKYRRKIMEIKEFQEERQPKCWKTCTRKTKKTYVKKLYHTGKEIRMLL